MRKRIEVERRWRAPGSSWMWERDSSYTLETLPPGTVLFLTGDPGSGKTDTVRNYVERNANAWSHRFVEASTQAHVTAWLEDCFVQDKELLLDAYDERSSSFRGSFLLDALRKAVASRRCPTLRIVCRGTHLPTPLIEETRTIIGADDKAPLVYQLLPLTGSQIENWIQQRLGSDASGFFDEVRKKQLEPYLIRPADLEAFVAVYLRDRTLGETPTDAWRAALRMELMEPNTDRRDISSEIGAKYSVDQRYRAAEILALAQTICDLGSIVLEPHQPFDSKNAVTIDALWTAAQPAFSDFTIESFGALIRETAQSRPFDRGSEGVVFASSARAQFLAAQFLLNRNPKQILNLFKDHRRGTRIPDRARAIAAEVAKFEPGLFRWLCENQPEVLLQGIVLDYSSDQRKQVAEALLRRREERTPWIYRGYRLSALAHPGLGSQLRPYLTGKNGDEDDLNLAIDIADHAKCTGVAKELGDIACDRSRDYSVRVNAAKALAHLGGAAAEKLRPILLQPAEEDLHDELLASVLIGLWPHGFKLSEAFSLLREPKESSTLYTGVLSYSSYGLHERITLSFLIPGLEWLIEQEKSDQHFLRDSFENLELVITKLAWENIESPKIANLLAQVADLRMKRHAHSLLPFVNSTSYSQREPKPGIEPQDFESDRERRHVLFEAWIRARKPESSWWGIRNFIGLGEIDYLLELAIQAVGVDREFLTKGVINIVYELVRGDRDDQLKHVDSKLQQLSVDLVAIREDVVQQSRQARRYRKPPLRKGFSDRRHQEAILEVLRTGDSPQFPQLLDHLGLDSRGWESRDFYELAEVERWQRLTPGEKDQVVRMASAFLQKGPSCRRPDLEYQQSLWDWAGVNGLLIIAQHAPEWLRTHRTSVKPWLPHVLVHHCYFERQVSASKALFEVLTTNEVCAELRIQLEEVLKQSTDPLNMRAFNELWREDVGAVIARRSRKWKSEIRQHVLVLLLLQRFPGLALEVEADLKSRSRERQLFAVRLALYYGLRPLYSLISDLALKDTEIRELVWDQLWDNRRINPEENVELFDVELLGEFFERSLMAKPPSEDVPFKCGAVNPQVTKQRLRDSFAAAVSKKKTARAWDLLDQWSRRPGLEWLERLARRSRQEWLEEAWAPPTLSGVIRLSLDPGKRYIVTANDLHDVVCEALEMIKPTAETQGVYWRDVGAGIPHLEVNITRNLKELLQPRLSTLVVNSEVDRLDGRLDIKVEIVVKSALGEPLHLTCIIEAKRCTHRNLKSALTTQLVQRYLTGDREQTGIYLVLWFEGLGPSGLKRDAIERLLEEQASKSPRRVSVVHFNIKGAKSVPESHRAICSD